MKIEKEELFAIILVALFIFGPLYLGETQSFVHKNGHAGGGQPPNPGDIIGALTVGILAFQAWIFSRQAVILDRQTTLTYQNFLLTHRPRLRIRNIVIKGSRFAPNQTVHGQFYVDNVGGTKAYVTESHCEFLWNVAGLPMERSYEGKDANNPLPKGTIIVGSLAKTAWFESGFPYPDCPPPGTDQANRAFFMGWIDYLDEAGLKRRTIFCREFLQRNGSARFWPIKDDPDYEYEQ